MTWFLNLCGESGLGKLRRQFFATPVRWCNGSTELFGGFSHGSNPCRTTKLEFFIFKAKVHLPSPKPGANFLSVSIRVHLWFN